MTKTYLPLEWPDLLRFQLQPILSADFWPLLESNLDNFYALDPDFLGNLKFKNHFEVIVFDAEKSVTYV